MILPLIIWELQKLELFSISLEGLSYWDSNQIPNVFAKWLKIRKKKNIVVFTQDIPLGVLSFIIIIFRTMPVRLDLVLNLVYILPQFDFLKVRVPKYILLVNVIFGET